jgi:hypothetical protein
MSEDVQAFFWLWLKDQPRLAEHKMDVMHGVEATQKDFTPPAYIGRGRMCGRSLAALVRKYRPESWHQM